MKKISDKFKYFIICFIVCCIIGICGCFSDRTNTMVELSIESISDKKNGIIEVIYILSNKTNSTKILLWDETSTNAVFMYGGVPVNDQFIIADNFIKKSSMKIETKTLDEREVFRFTQRYIVNMPSGEYYAFAYLTNEKCIRTKILPFVVFRDINAPDKESSVHRK